MNRLNLLITIFLVFSLFSCAQKTGNIEIENDQFKITIDEKGFVQQFLDNETTTNYLAVDTLSPLMAIRVDSIILLPEKAEYNPANNQIKLQFPDYYSATISCEVKESHINFELTEISNVSEVEMIIWGPYQTTIDEVIGETVGVVQGSEFSMGLQALNPKTLGGYPWTDNDCMPQINIFAQEDLTDMKEGGGKDYVLYRVEAAKPTRFGSSIQAYCRNRFEDRLIENLNHERYIAPAYEDGGVIGSKIAIFGVSKENSLKAIGQIEIDENLPHPQLDGEWTKTSPLASSAYIIMNFAKKDIDRAIEITRKAGLKYLYHDGPFKNWGHFELNPDRFPNGIEDLKYCVEKAEAEGLKMGLHTLSNFITTDDEYVTPVPDPRLGKVGSSTILDAIDETQKEIKIASPDFFNQFKNNHLKTVQIGNELIRYGTVSASEPWTLLDCERGAFGTTAAAHAKDAAIHKLIDHGYKVFLTDAALSIEVAKNIADLYNKTGLRQISFDGLEGNRSTGMGNYGEILFTQTWFDNINDDIKSHYIADASRTTHYFWHMYTRMNWGEPWYAGFRESQTEYRLKNQAYFKRNLMPGMLGWFRMTAETSIEDIEWMLARSAAFDAGYAFVVDYNSLDKNKHSDQILHLIGEWEKVRIAGLFSDEQKKLMEDTNNEYHLEQTDNGWDLVHINSAKFKHKKLIRQPGEPTHAQFKFEHATDNTPFRFNLSARNGALQKITMEIDNFKSFEIPVNLEKGQTLKYAGGSKAQLFDANWNKLKDVILELEGVEVGKGDHTIVFDCEFSDEETEAALELRLANGIDKITK